jgi:chromosome segregation ATPase
MTFKQVSKHFNEIFLKIVPQGTAHLVMRTNDNFEEEVKDTVNFQPPGTEWFAGIGTKIWAGL